MKQLQQQQHSDKTNLQGLTGTPLVAGSPIRHESTVQGNPVEVQTYQPPWKALSEFALQSDLDQPAFQQLVSFSESGSLGNSSGSDVTSLSSQLPDTPNSMVPSPVETWDPAVVRDHCYQLLLLQGQFAAWSWSPFTLFISTPTSNPACDQLITSPIEKPIFSFFLFSKPCRRWNKEHLLTCFVCFYENSLAKTTTAKNKIRTTKNNWCMTLHMENKDVQKTSQWMYTRDLPSEKKKITSYRIISMLQQKYSAFSVWLYCVLFLQHEHFLYLICRVHLTLCLKVRAWYSAKVFVV